jgi:RNA polymerase subunit RPABC4/transcription elongation factor Spt4
MGMLERLFGGHGGSRHGGGSACPACRAVNGPGARFCQQCGGSMQPAACRQCGTAMQAGAKFCAQCGQPSHAPLRG